MGSLIHPENYQITAHAMATLLTAIVTLTLGLIVSIRQRHYRVGRLFGAITIPISIWLFFFSLMSAAVSAQQALTWARLGYVAIPFIPAAAYHFSVVLLRFYDRRRMIVRTGWTLALLFAAFAVFSP